MLDVQDPVHEAWVRLLLIGCLAVAVACPTRRPPSAAQARLARPPTVSSSLRLTIVGTNGLPA